MAKDRLAGDFVRLSHDWRMREEELERQKTRTTEDMISYCLLVKSYTPIVIYATRAPTKKLLKELYDKYAKRMTFQKEPWALKTVKKRFINQ